jgi:hypothetical protein
MLGCRRICVNAAGPRLFLVQYKLLESLGAFTNITQACG